MNWRDQLASAVAAVPDDDQAELVGELAKYQAMVLLSSAPVESTASSDDENLTADQVAALCNTSRSWVYRHRDVLRGQKLSGRVLRFRRSAVERYLESKR